MLQRFFDAIDRCAEAVKGFWEAVKKFWKGAVYFMAVVYATLILNGAKKFADVPALMKAQVKQVLTDLGVAELAE